MPRLMLGSDMPLQDNSSSGGTVAKHPLINSVKENIKITSFFMVLLRFDCF